MMMARKMMMVVMMIMMMRRRRKGRRRKRRMVRDAQHLAVRCKSGGGEFPAHIATLSLILETFILKYSAIICIATININFVIIIIISMIATLRLTLKCLF